MKKSQSFIHQVSVSLKSAIRFKMMEFSKSQSFIHQVSVSLVNKLLHNCNPQKVAILYSSSLGFSLINFNGGAYQLYFQGRNPLFIKSRFLSAPPFLPIKSTGYYLLFCNLELLTILMPHSRLFFSLSKSGFPNNFNTLHYVL